MASNKNEYDYRAGSALLKKQLADRAGKPVVLPSKKNVTRAAKQIGGAVLTIAGPGKVVKGVQLTAKAIKAAKAAKAAAKTKPTPASKITAQQKATTANKSRMSALEKQIKETEAQIKANAKRAAELAKKPKAPGAPSDRELGLLDANKRLAAELKKIRQAYSDAKNTW
jgi:hypothetical protein